MCDRLEQLRMWGLPAMLLRIAEGDLPHPAFEAWCESLHSDERRRQAGLNLDCVEARDETAGNVSAALWEHDFRDGHAFEVIYCTKAENKLEFWHVDYDDTDGPHSECIATSEQGVLFWLFFSLIGSEFIEHGENAYSTLAAAAKSVGFEHLVEVFRLEEEIGSDYERRGELTARSRAIA